MEHHHPEPIWTPDPALTADTRVEHFRHWVNDRMGLELSDYPTLHAWSVQDLSGFWRAVWDYFDVQAEQEPDEILVDGPMPDVEWFPGTRLNYVDQVFRHDPNRIAIRDRAEQGGPDPRNFSLAEVRQQVANLAHALVEVGVQPGDRVVGYLPNIAEAVIAFLAAASVGAIWAACGQDYSATAAVDRLGQLDPVVLVVADGYQYAGKDRDRRPVVDEIATAMPSLKAVVGVSRLGLGFGPSSGGVQILAWDEVTTGAHDLAPVQVPFDHPLWVLFSSGTTGKPKGIMHGHGGVLLEHLKQIAFHLDLGEGDSYFWFTSPSWMMWNFQVAGLLVGASIVTFDGNPGYPTAGELWRLAEDLRVKVLGTSPAYLAACEKKGIEPGTSHDLSPLQTLGVTGSVLPPAAYAWVRDHVSPAIAVGAISGGTDVVSAFVGSVPTMPIWPGELSVACLGTAVEAWDDFGKPVIEEAGELVITRPMPSMPVRFWNDPQGTKLREAYFEMYPGIWRHGDLVTVTDRGSVIIHGRSDSTLNRNGIRMGSADIYQAVEAITDIVECLVVGVEQPDGSYWMPLFVHLDDGVDLTDELRSRINAAIRDHASPRHVPDDIIAVPGIPHTRTGKKLEVPIKRILQGADPTAVLDPASVDNATLLDHFVAPPR